MANRYRDLLIGSDRAQAWPEIKAIARWGQRFIRGIEPWGILVAVVGFGFAFTEFQEARKERREAAAVRHAQLELMLIDRLKAAREADRAYWDAREVAPFDRRPVSDRGQKEVIEAMVLSGVPLSCRDLTNVDLTGVDVSGGEFAFTDFSGSRLVSANLTGADLSGAWLIGTDLALASLSGAKLRDAVLTKARFFQTKLDGVDWEGASYILVSPWGLPRGDDAVSLLDLASVYGALNERGMEVARTARTFACESR